MQITISPDQMPPNGLDILFLERTRKMIPEVMENSKNGNNTTLEMSFISIDELVFLDKFNEMRTAYQSFGDCIDIGNRERPDRFRKFLIFETEDIENILSRDRH
jgi:hypothetical protein